jgi:hypothetical protein
MVSKTVSGPLDHAILLFAILELFVDIRIVCHPGLR